MDGPLRRLCGNQAGDGRNPACGRRLRSNLLCSDAVGADPHLPEPAGRRCRGRDGSQRRQGPGRIRQPHRHLPRCRRTGSAGAGRADARPADGRAERAHRPTGQQRVDATGHVLAPVGEKHPELRRKEVLVAAAGFEPATTRLLSRVAVLSRVQRIGTATRSPRFCRSARPRVGFPAPRAGGAGSRRADPGPRREGATAFAHAPWCTGGP